jgi:hypothetical protein
MILNLFKIELASGDKQRIGIAKDVIDADKVLKKLARAEARRLTTAKDGSEVVRERDGYCVKLFDKRVALYSFDMPD